MEPKEIINSDKGKKKNQSHPFFFNFVIIY